MRTLVGSAALALAAFLVAETAEAAEACSLKRIATLPLAPQETGVPLIEATLNGKPRKLLVDTGAYRSHLFPATVRELGLVTSRSAGSSVSVDGSVSNLFARAPTRLGDIEAGTLQYMITGGDDMQEIGDGGVAGLLGQEVLKLFDIDFDFPGRTMSIFSQDHCPGQVVHWAATAVAVVPFKMDDNNHITFAVSVNGRSMTAILDSGFSYTTMNQSPARRLLDFDADAPGVQQLGELEGKPIYLTRVQSITFEGITVANPAIRVYPDLITKATARVPLGSMIPVTDVNLPSVIIGMSTLSRLHVYIAYKERKLYITPGSTAGAAISTAAPQ